MICRDRLVRRLSEALSSDYVALLGPRDCALQAFIDELASSDEPPRRGMRFLRLALPAASRDSDEFREMVIARLSEAAPLIPPEEKVEHEVNEEIQRYRDSSTNMLLRRVLTKMGYVTAASPLVVVLDGLGNAPIDPLKDLLRTLREFHLHRGSLGTAGHSLRFLASGGKRLWELCFKPIDEESPYNIARRMFLDDLAVDDVIDRFERDQLPSVLKLLDITGGVVGLFEIALSKRQNPTSLDPFFAQIQDGWNAMQAPSRRALEQVVQGQTRFESCACDASCTQIPLVRSPWDEAFWNGFVRVTNQRLVWRSSLHKAFVSSQCGISLGETMKSLSNSEPLERVAELEEALKNSMDKSGEEASLEKAQSLALQIGETELAELLATARMGVRGEHIEELIKKFAAGRSEKWWKVLSHKVNEHKAEIVELLVTAAIAATKAALK